MKSRSYWIDGVEITVGVGQVWYVELPDSNNGMRELMKATVTDMTEKTIELKWIRPPGPDEEPMEITARFWWHTVTFVEQVE